MTAQDQQNGPAELRAALDRANERAATAEAELRQVKTTIAFEKAQVPAAAATLYTGDDVTVEAVTAWAAEHGIPVGTPTEAPQVAEPVEEGYLGGDGAPPAVERVMETGPTPVEQDLSQIAAAAGSHHSTVGEALPPQISHQEFLKMLENPATRSEAERLYVEGRVRRHEKNQQAQLAASKGILRQ